ncbi:DNA-binding MurR/RpiR family transcriptional regulator [Enterococcus sp. PF1-24]|uniref:MurR/RpiR family transcriptional regulator n=1 Tax=unclassified Enterococcus TaxID=2608891 RepID=UPI002472F2A5|nr:MULTISPECIES: SIS domain-containing protein [unclassified Enterococcus]MDH6364586.1 DNA-binding MurR/RpiR family transcriptional regulator [Enterococcus sp. PFB1-1]MDH6401687.1 DNA-binding MurR/RpiR family transcriptional regulator [Enterococcus sp. PF1-24]
MNINYLKDVYQLKQTEIQILLYLEEHLQELNDLSIRFVAKNCFTSPATIIRLAKKLNLSGYSELIYKIKESHLAPNTIADLALEEKSIQSFCQLMNQNQDCLISVISLGFASHIANYMSEVFNFHGIPSITTAHTQLINRRNNQKILLIVVSHSGEEEQLKATVALAKAAEQPIIAFLGTQQSTIAKQADLVFSSESFSPFSTSVARPQFFFGRTLITFESLICTYINAIK